VVKKIFSGEFVTQGAAGETAAPLLPGADSENDRKRWRVGTLAYTSGGLAVLFLWLLGGDFSWQLRERAMSPAIPLLLRSFGGSDFIAGLLMGFIPAALGIVIQPVVSYMSDRYRSRLGRRIPFLLGSTPFAVVAMFGLAASPFLGHWIHRALGPGAPSTAACVISIFALFWTIFELAALVCNALHGALINDVVPRPVLGRFFGMFRVVSLGAGMLFHLFLLQHVEKHYVPMFISLGLLYGVTFTLMCFKVKEGQYPPPPPSAPRSEPWLDRVSDSIAIYLRECFSRPLYIWFFVSFLLANMAFTPINLFSLYFSQSVGMSAAEYGKWSFVQLLCSLIQAPIIGWMCDKFHPLRMTLFALVMYTTTTIIAYFFVHGRASFIAAHVICGTCSGIWLTATAPLPQMLFPKVKFATFASCLLNFWAIGSMITGPVMGYALDRLNPGVAPIHRDYHTIYLWACVFIGLSLLATMEVYRRFMAMGGPKGYVAPE
jgi:Na+/melibiose symporter-like transporter